MLVEERIKKCFCYLPPMVVMTNLCFGEHMPLKDVLRSYAYIAPRVDICIFLIMFIDWYCSLTGHHCSLESAP